MTIAINLTPVEDERLYTFATTTGISPEDLIKKLLNELLIPQPKSTSEYVLARLQQWQKDTATETSPRVSAHELFAQMHVEASMLTDATNPAHITQFAPCDLWTSIKP